MAISSMSYMLLLITKTTHKLVTLSQGNRDAQSQNEKKIMLSNNKFLGKCSYGKHPWIRLAMDCERMVEKGITFILYLGTTYDVSSMESIGNSRD